MISKKMAGALNEQINKEMYSGYIYLAMSAEASDMGLDGAAKWLGMQAAEEMSHARKMYDYIISQGSKVVLKAIPAPPNDYGSLKAMFKATLDHEKKVTAMINKLMDMAITEKDHATQAFLQWFVTEQVEEEESANDVLAKLELAGDKGNALFMIDRMLAARGNE